MIELKFDINCSMRDSYLNGEHLAADEMKVYLAEQSGEWGLSICLDNLWDLEKFRAGGHESNSVHFMMNKEQVEIFANYLLIQAKYMP